MGQKVLVSIDDLAEYVRAEISLHHSVSTSGEYPGDVQKARNSAFRRLRDNAFNKLKGE